MEVSHSLTQTMSSPTTTTITSRQIFRQSFKILNSNPFHFLTISLLFIPFTIAISAVSHNLLTLQTLTTLLAVTVTVILPAVAGTALIAYSTHQSIHRKPLTFFSAFKSLSHSFIPLISTFIVYILISITISMFIQVITLVLLFVVIWGYTAAVSVLESKSGFIPLLQSIKQLFQIVPVSFSIVSFTGFGIITTVFTYPAIYGKGTTAMCISILFYCCNHMLASSTILFYVVANTVWYVRCKVARGEEIVYTPVEWNVSAKEGFNFMMFWIFAVRIIAFSILSYQGLIVIATTSVI